MGTQVVVCDQEGFDILAFAPAAIRIEVKATARGAVSANRLEFNTGKGGTKSKVTKQHCEVVALASSSIVWREGSTPTGNHGA